jgi:hypothetical protein
VAALSSGGAQAWGNNGDGELGNGTSTPKAATECECIPIPGPVSGLSGPQAIAAGNFHSLALLPNGNVQAWGFNGRGQLGESTANAFRLLPTTVSSVSGASSVFAGTDNSFALIGPSQALRISIVGAGAGSVGGAGILCPQACEGRFPQGQVEALRAQPAAGSGFAGFSNGPCIGTGPCKVRLDQDQSVTATFGPPKGTAITGSKVSSAKKAASLSFTAPGAITGFECALISPRKRHRRGHRGRLARAGRKKPKPRFAQCAAPMRFKHLKPGRYTFEVRALDILGPDANPAVKRFTIKHRRAKKSKHRR